jgi:hypothetical protein
MILKFYVVVIITVYLAFLKEIYVTAQSNCNLGPRNQYLSLELMDFQLIHQGN